MWGGGAGGRGQRGGWGGRVSQTRCSQAHTSSLCDDLLLVWILFRSNKPLQKRFCLISSLLAIYDIAGELKWSHPPPRWKVHYLEILSMCAASPGPQHEELSEQGGCATVVWTLWHEQVCIELRGDASGSHPHP